MTGGTSHTVDGCARRRGTTVTVRSLFFNLPARAKFLRAASVESRAITEVVTVLALANPGVAFHLESGDRELLSLAAVPTLHARIAAIWGPEMAGELMVVAHREGNAALSGLVQRPHSATPGGRRAHLFINGRPFGERLVVRAADRGYRTTIPEGVHPSLFLFLALPEGEVDVNVHPTKAEVRFRDRTAVERLVEEGIRAALAALDSTPSIGRRGGTESSASGAEALYAPSGALHGRVRERLATSPGDGAGITEAPEPQMALFVTGGGGNSGGTPAVPPPAVEERTQEMWQVHNSYILAETRSGLILVDQHSAHERVLYEELTEGIERGERVSQRLLFPLTLRLSPAECATVEGLSGILLRAGFEIEPFGGQAVIVHGVPHPHPHFDAERCLREMIAELTEGSELVNAARTQHQRIALSFACKGAIKAGQKLSREEMRELFDRLFATKLPFHDIHGRPTVVQLSLAELHRKFGRG